MPESQQLADSVVHLFLTLIRYQRSLNEEIKKQTGQSSRRLTILRCLSEKSPRSVGEIGRYLYISDATASRILDDMEQHGLVTRQRCQKDSRKVLVAPTEAGLRMAASAPKGAVAFMHEQLPTLPPEELRVILAGLERLAQVLQIDTTTMEEHKPI